MITQLNEKDIHPVEYSRSEISTTWTTGPTAQVRTTHTVRYPRRARQEATPSESYPFKITVHPVAAASAEGRLTGQKRPRGSEERKGGGLAEPKPEGRICTPLCMPIRGLLALRDIRGAQTMVRIPSAWNCAGTGPRLFMLGGGTTRRTLLVRSTLRRNAPLRAASRRACAGQAGSSRTPSGLR